MQCELMRIDNFLKLSSCGNFALRTAQAVDPVLTEVADKTSRGFSAGKRCSYQT